MILGGLFSSIIFGLILYFSLWSKVGANGFAILIMATIYFLLTPLEGILVNYYTLKEKALPYAYGAAFTGVITTSITLITIKYFRLGYMGWVISLPTTVIVTYLFFFRKIFIREKLIPQFKFKKSFFNKAMRVGLPLTPHNLSLYILGICDRILLEYFKIPIKSIGFYSQGYSLGSQGNIVVSGIFQALSKKLQEAFRGNEKEHIVFIRRAIIVVPLLIAIILFLGCLWMKELFLILFKNPELQKAYPVAIVVMSSYMFWSIYSFFTYPLSINNKTFSVSKISLIAAIFNVIGNIIFIPYFGIWAAVGVTYASYIIFGFAGLLNKQNRTFFNGYINILKTCIYFLLINTLLFVIVYLCKDLMYLFKGFITIGIFMGLFLLYKINYKLFS